MKGYLFNGLIALFPLSFANCAILHPFFFFERLCTPSFANCVLFKIIIKRGENGQKMGCKITQKKRGCKIAQLVKR